MADDDPGFELTEEDVDMLLEEADGKVVDKGSLAANIAAIERRIQQLERERSQFESLSAKGHKIPHFLKVNARDLRKANDLLAAYRAQQGMQN